MATILILTLVLAIIPIASLRFGANSRDMRPSHLRSIVS